MDEHTCTACGSAMTEMVKMDGTRHHQCLPCRSKALDMESRRDCAFCEIVAGKAPADIVAHWPDALAIAPLNPVVPGHTLVLPRTHVADALEDPQTTATTMRRACELARGGLPCNIITSVGEAATQTVFHLHIHIVPRRKSDGLALPWTSHE